MRKDEEVSTSSHEAARARETDGPVWVGIFEEGRVKEAQEAHRCRIKKVIMGFEVVVEIVLVMKRLSGHAECLFLAILMLVSPPSTLMQSYGNSLPSSPFPFPYWSYLCRLPLHTFFNSPSL